MVQEYNSEIPKSIRGEQESPEGKNDLGEIRYKLGEVTAKLRTLSETPDNVGASAGILVGQIEQFQRKASENVQTKTETNVSKSTESENTEYSPEDEQEISWIKHNAVEGKEDIEAHIKEWSDSHGTMLKLADSQTDQKIQDTIRNSTTKHQDTLNSMLVLVDNLLQIIEDKKPLGEIKQAFDEIMNINIGERANLTTTEASSGESTESESAKYTPEEKEKIKRIDEHLFANRSRLTTELDGLRMRSDTRRQLAGSDPDALAQADKAERTFEANYSDILQKIDGVLNLIEEKKPFVEIETAYQAIRTDSNKETEVQPENAEYTPEEKQEIDLLKKNAVEIKEDTETRIKEWSGTDERILRLADSLPDQTARDKIYNSTKEHQDRHNSMLDLVNNLLQIIEDKKSFDEIKKASDEIQREADRLRKELDENKQKSELS